jgi:GT2 family glycosyltransferase
MAPHVPSGLHGALQVAERGRRAPGAAGREQAQDVGAQGVGQLGRPAPDGAPGHEEDVPAPGRLPSVSVVVATRHRADVLDALVHAVLSDPGALELIIVVDGTDDPDSTEELRRLGVANDRLRHTTAECLGQMGALDRGVDMARGDVVLLLDDDVLPVTPLASGHARRQAGREDLVVVGAMPVQPPRGARVEVGSRIYAQAYAAHCAALVRGDGPVLQSLWFGNLSLRRERCLGVGLRSADFTCSYHADRDFGYRAADAGLIGVFDPSLRAVHLHSRSRQAFLRDARRQGAGIRMVHDVHPERAGPFSPHSLIDTGHRSVDVVLRAAVVTPGRRSVVTTVVMGVAGLAGRLHLGRIEVAAAKVAQHVMQWQGAMAGADG